MSLLGTLRKQLNVKRLRPMALTTHGVMRRLTVRDRRNTYAKPILEMRFLDNRNYIQDCQVYDVWNSKMTEAGQESLPRCLEDLCSEDESILPENLLEWLVSYTEKLCRTWIKI